MKVRNSLLVMLGIISISLIPFASLNGHRIESSLHPQLQPTGATAQSTEWFVITGLVENPLNLTYSELRNFPMLSEVNMLECIGAGQGGLSVIYNWTGVPLFYLLSMARVIPGPYREVVFNATDGFSSSVLLETAMDPTSILALQANGTDLEEMSGFGSGYRVVFPCKWGYKWVKDINQIVIVDYDYKGRYEQVHPERDEAIHPNCTMPLTDPQVQIFTIHKTKEYAVKALSNSSIESFAFESDKRLICNITGPEETTGYLFVSFPKGLLTSPYQIYVDGTPVEYRQTEAGENAYLFFTYRSGVQTIEIEGTPRIFPDINDDGQVDIRDITIVAMAFGSGVGDENWNQTADLNDDDVVDIRDITVVALEFGRTVNQN